MDLMDKMDSIFYGPNGHALKKVGISDAIGRMQTPCMSEALLADLINSRQQLAKGRYRSTLKAYQEREKNA